MGSSYSRKSVQQEAPAHPDERVIVWDSGDFEKSAPVVRKLGPIVRNFVDVFCEVDPKLHAPCNEVTSAMFVHIQNNGVYTNTFSTASMHCCLSLLRATEPGVKLSGIMTRNHQFELLVIKGIRLKAFPERIRAPQPYTWIRTNSSSEASFQLIAQMFD